MDTLTSQLRDADPLRLEAARPEDERQRVRSAAIAAASQPTRRPRATLPRYAVVLLIACGALTATVVARPDLWPRHATLHAAAVRLELRLAQTAFSPGLRSARVVNSAEVLYLNPDVILTNDDIVASRVVPGDGPSRFGVAVTFSADGARRMRDTTSRHIGELIAIVIDGEVVAAPRVRSPIDREAIISGEYTRAEADRIAEGLLVR
jgi:preprotein translocase subunit SecD